MVPSSLVFGLLLYTVSVKSCKFLCTPSCEYNVSFHSDCDLEWHYTITGLELIFQDELVRDDRTNVLATPRDGTVICRSENQAHVGWHFANSALISPTSTINNHFRHVGEQFPV